MLLEDALIWIEVRGLPADAALLLKDEMPVWPPGEPPAPSIRCQIARLLRARGVRNAGAALWPEAGHIRRLAARLRASGVDCVWRGGAGYPSLLVQRLGADAPPWMLVAGSAARCEGPTCAMIGSRTAPAPLLEAARRLARALASAGVAIVSGNAEGADAAAHLGALESGPGGAGTVALPARGIMLADLGAARAQGPAGSPHSGGALTCLGAARPDAPFNAGLALRRNTLIAALSGGVVLVAGGLQGGSSYAVRWAMAHGLPLWCFEAGRATPPGNASLIRGGWAQALPLREAPEALAGRIRAGLVLPGAVSQRAAPRYAASDSGQLDWLARAFA